MNWQHCVTLRRSHCTTRGPGSYSLSYQDSSRTIYPLAALIDDRLLTAEGWDFGFPYVGTEQASQCPQFPLSRLCSLSNSSSIADKWTPSTWLLCSEPLELDTLISWSNWVRTVIHTREAYWALQSLYWMSVLSLQSATLLTSSHTFSPALEIRGKSRVYLIKRQVVDNRAGCPSTIYRTARPSRTSSGTDQYHSIWFRRLEDRWTCYLGRSSARVNILYIKRRVSTLYIDDISTRTLERLSLDITRLSKRGRLSRLLKTTSTDRVLKQNREDLELILTTYNVSHRVYFLFAYVNQLIPSDEDINEQPPTNR